MESALCPSSRSESCSGCWLTVSERSLAPLDDSVSLGVGAVGLLYLEQPLCIHWRPAVCLRGAGLRQGLVFCDTFFNAFVFQKWQCEVYWSSKQTGVGETGHALTFPARANMGLASLMRSLQWPRRGPPIIAGPLGQSSKSFCLAQLRTGHKYDFLALKPMLQLLYAGCELDCLVLTRNDVVDLRNLIPPKFHWLLHVLIKSFPLNEL